jgi:hypothetical protein
MAQQPLAGVVHSSDTWPQLAAQCRKQTRPKAQQLCKGVTVAHLGSRLLREGVLRCDFGLVSVQVGYPWLGVWHGQSPPGTLFPPRIDLETLTGSAPEVLLSRSGHSHMRPSPNPSAPRTGHRLASSSLAPSPRASFAPDPLLSPSNNPLALLSRCHALVLPVTLTPLTTPYHSLNVHRAPNPRPRFYTHFYFLKLHPQLSQARGITT